MGKIQTVKVYKDSYKHLYDYTKTIDAPEEAMKLQIYQPHEILAYEELKQRIAFHLQLREADFTIQFVETSL